MKRIRLTESCLHKIIKESVKKILNEQGRLYNRNTRETLEFFPRQNTLSIISNNGNKYLYYYTNGEWERNAAPDFGSLNANDLARVGVPNPEQVLNSAKNTINARQQKRNAEEEAERLEMEKRAKEYVKQHYAETQKQAAPQTREQMLAQAADMIQKGDRPNNLGGNEEYYVHEMIMRGMITVQDAIRVYGAAPGFVSRFR